MATANGTILLTGPNGGIGIGFVSQLLKSPYAATHHSIYAVRDPAKAIALKKVLTTAPKDHKHDLVAVDFSSLDSIRAFAADINGRVSGGSLPRIQALILNAGVQDTARESFTRDGMERTFAVNYLANFLLSLLLLQSMDPDHGRIIHVGSTSAHIQWFPNAGNFSSEDQKRTLITATAKMAKGVEEFPDGSVYLTGQRRYALSKLLLMEWMYEFQRRLDRDPKFSNIAVLGHDPGWIGGTGISRNTPLSVKITMMVFWYLGYLCAPFSSNPLIRTAAKNGTDLLRVCFDDEAFGKYPKALYVDGSVLGYTPTEANDVPKQKELWKGSLEYAGIKEGDTVLQDWK